MWPTFGASAKRSPASIGTSTRQPDAVVIDAAGKYVFPGFIDPHTHIYLPFMGTYAKDDYETGTKAAIVGGTTTLFEMCCPSRAMEAAEGFEIMEVQGRWKSRM